MPYFDETFQLRTNQQVIIISILNNHPQDLCGKVLLENHNLYSKIKYTLIPSTLFFHIFFLILLFLLLPLLKMVGWPDSS